MMSLLVASVLLAPPNSSAKPGELAPMAFRRRVTRTFSGSYFLYLPVDYGKPGHERWPVVLFLHGSGESGDNLDDVKKHGPTKEVLNGRNFPFILVAPQSPVENGWDPYVLTALLNEIEAKYHVDRDREYLTGLSMGGFGTYTLAALTPQRFAAIAPICGGASVRIAPLLKGVPIWSFHGDKDPIVPLRMEQPIIDALTKQGGEVKFTVVENGGHDVWTQIYAGEDIYNWLLQHKRPAKTKLR